MFTGIIEEIGEIIEIQQYENATRLLIKIPASFKDARVGQSISVNGCCLTISDIQPTQWKCDIVQETLERTNLQFLKVGDKVNLEQALRMDDRLGGHLVQGHIDGIGHISQKKQLPDGSFWLTISASPSLMRYVIYKGSIAVDGISLTIAELEEGQFSLAIIPHTAKMTTLGFKQVGDTVNLESDMMAKYVERLLNPFARAL